MVRVQDDGLGDLVMQVKYIRGLDDRFDKALFITAVFGGIGLITLIKSFGASLGTFGGHNVSSIIAVLTAVVIILLYALFIWQSRERSALSVDRASDNAYYIGLLFTLWSLGLSLINLSAVTSEAGRLVLAVLPDFGLALGSTIAGIFARVMLQQLRGDPDDIENEVREELGKSALALRSSIGQIVADLSSLSSQISVSLNELSTNVTEVMENTAASSDRTNQAIANNFERINQKSEEQMNLIYRSSSNVIGQMEGLVSRIQSEFKGLGDAPKELEGSIKNVSQSMSGLATSLAQISTSNIEFQSQLTELSNQFRMLNSAVDAEQMQRISEATIANLAQLQSQSEALNQEMGQYQNSAKEFGETTTTATDVVNEYIGALRNAAKFVNDFVNGRTRN